MSQAEEGPAPDERLRIGPALGCMLVFALGAAALVGLWTKLQAPIRAPNGARVLSHPDLRWGLAVQLEAGELRVFSTQGEVYRERVPGELERTEHAAEQATGHVVLGRGDVVAYPCGGQYRRLDLAEPRRGMTWANALEPQASATEGDMFAFLAADPAEKTVSQLVLFKGRGDELGRIPVQPLSPFAIAEGVIASVSTDRFAEIRGVGEGLGQAAPRLRVPLASKPSVLRLSPDGTKLAIAEAKGRVAIWDLEQGHKLGEFVAGDERVLTALAFSPGGERIATGNGLGLLQLWTLAGEEVLELPYEHRTLSSRGSPSEVISIAVDEERVVWSVQERIYEHRFEAAPK